jgi:hypothetical protein
MILKIEWDMNRGTSWDEAEYMLRCAADAVGADSILFKRVETGPARMLVAVTVEFAAHKDVDVAKTLRRVTENNRQLSGLLKRHDASGLKGTVKDYVRLPFEHED